MFSIFNAHIENIPIGKFLFAVLLSSLIVKIIELYFASHPKFMDNFMISNIIALFICIFGILLMLFVSI